MNGIECARCLGVAVGVGMLDLCVRCLMDEAASRRMGVFIPREHWPIDGLLDFRERATSLDACDDADVDGEVCDER